MNNEYYGDYETGKFLGEGFTSKVYEAVNSKTGQRVALKVAKAGIDTGRFRVEAQALRALKHPGLCSVYEYNIDREPYFIAMELVEGQALAEWLKGIEVHAHVPLSDAFDIIRQIGESLLEAHKSKVIHRDVKPQNVVRKDSGELKLVDFGFCRRLDMSDNLTLPGTLMGTPDYMSPEQVNCEPVDHCTDIWSLGVLFFRLLAGSQPFVVSKRDLSAILREEVPDLLTERPDAPIATKVMIGKMLAKSTQDRYQSMQEVLDALLEIETEPTASSSLSFLDATVLIEILSEQFPDRRVDPERRARVRHAEQVWNARGQHAVSSPTEMVQLLDEAARALWSLRNAGASDHVCKMVRNSVQELRDAGCDVNGQWDELEDDVRVLFFQKCYGLFREGLEKLLNLLIRPPTGNDFPVSTFLKLLATPGLGARQALALAEAVGWQSKDFWTGSPRFKSVNEQTLNKEGLTIRFLRGRPNRVASEDASTVRVQQAGGAG